MEAVGANGWVDSYSFFRALGFKEVHAMDISPYEGADIIFDLNEPNLPAKLCDRFDYILDGGTTEHVFNFAQAMFNIAKMLKKGGKVFHYIPATGHVNHGYYSLSPSVLADFYNSNEFQVHKIDIILKKNGYVEPITSMADCVSTEPDYRLFNLRDTDALPGYIGILRCIATKKSATELQNPKQTHWYGIVNGDLLQEMWSVDLDLANPKAAIGVWGLENFSQIFLNVISHHKSFEKRKIRAFFTYDDAEKPSNFAGFPVKSAEEILSSGINTLFIASLDNNLYPQLQPLENHGIKIVRLVDYMPALQS